MTRLQRVVFFFVRERTFLVGSKVFILSPRRWGWYHNANKGSVFFGRSMRVGPIGIVTLRKRAR